MRRRPRGIRRASGMIQSRIHWSVRSLWKVFGHNSRVGVVMRAPMDKSMVQLRVSRAERKLMTFSDGDMPAGQVLWRRRLVVHCSRCDVTHRGCRYIQLATRVLEPARQRLSRTSDEVVSGGRTLISGRDLTSPRGMEQTQSFPSTEHLLPVSIRICVYMGLA